MLRRLGFLLILAAACGTFATAFGDGSQPDTTTPLAAFAVRSGNVTLVEWTPGVQAPNHYNVYGFTTTGTRSTLAEVAGSAEPQAEVPSGEFVTYSVSAITGTTESPAMVATTASVPCVFFDIGPPPDYAVGCVEGTGIGGKVRAEASLP